MARIAQVDNGTAIKDPESFEKIRTVLDQIKKEHWIEGYKASDSEAFGILMAKWFCWDGVQVLEATYSGLEDSNFHTENKTISSLLEALHGND